MRKDSVGKKEASEEVLDFTRPCLGFFLHGGVKSIAIMEMGVQLAMLLVLSIGIVAVENDWKTMKDSQDSNELAKYYIRPLYWVYYYIYIFISMKDSRKLYSAANERNPERLKSWLYASVLLFLPWFVFVCSHTFWVTWAHPMGAAAFWGFAAYKVYTIWVVYAFLQELKYYADFNVVLGNLSDEEIEDFMKGTPKVTGESDGEDFSDRPYRREIEIPRPSIQLDPQAQPLGCGAFGRVVKGLLRRAKCDPFVSSNFQPVAVKMVASDAHAIYLKALLSELKVLSYIGRHENIVNLIGACTSDLKRQQLYIVVELCPYGSVLKFLQSNRVHLTQSCYSNCSGNTPEWEAIRQEYLTESEGLTTLDLVKWSMQTASGMEFIASKNVVHGDLAARNILLTEEKDIKIADFGMSKQLYHYSYCVNNKNQPLPWRWSSPETLSGGRFSSLSDIWSYGCVLWEFFSCGSIPYFYWKHFSQNFVDSLQSGELRLEKPMYATLEIYDKMKECWNTDPTKRPSFSALKAYFSKCYEDCAESKSKDAQ